MKKYVSFIHFDDNLLSVLLTDRLWRISPAEAYRSSQQTIQVLLKNEEMKMMYIILIKCTQCILYTLRLTGIYITLQRGNGELK